MKTAKPNTTADGGLACAFGEPWLGPHPLCAAETARICGVPVEDVSMPDYSRFARRASPDSYQDGIGVWRCKSCLKEQPCGCGQSFTKGEVEPMAKKKKVGKKKPERKKGPRAQVLPGMEQVRSVTLDRLCESIGEGRDTINKARTEEKDDNRQALRVMHDGDRTVYRHAGVELVRVPGEEKLRVRTTKEDASEITKPEKSEKTADAAEGGDQTE